MADEELNLRIVRSRRVLYGWEQHMPGGKPEDVLKIIGDEIVVLERIVAEHPEKALTVGDLLKRYRALQGRVRESATH